MEPFSDDSAMPAVRGFLHRADAGGDGIVLAHGAGSDCNAPLLTAMAEAFHERGITVLRCDLPYRQRRPSGPPFPAESAQDREGIRRAAAAVRRHCAGRMFLGGHSYGGRQASMAATEDPELADGLLLFSYPLHPPHKAAGQRTAHFPKLHTRALFVHGSCDAFGSIEELRAAIAQIPAPAELLVVEGAGHDLGFGRKGGAPADLPARVVEAFSRLTGGDEPVRIPITDVFDLHSVPDRDLKAVVEAYLEEARARGFHYVRIIHGRGIGVRREIVRAVLGRTSFVESFRDAPSDAGGWGATLATLRA